MAAPKRKVSGDKPHVDTVRVTLHKTCVKSLYKYYRGHKRVFPQVLAAHGVVSLEIARGQAHLPGPAVPARGRRPPRSDRRGGRSRRSFRPVWEKADRPGRIVPARRVASCKPYTLNQKPYTLNPNPKPYTLLHEP